MNARPTTNLPLENETQRIDPPSCDCLDCRTGIAIPFNECSNLDLTDLYFGIYENCSGMIPVGVGSTADWIEE